MSIYYYLCSLVPLFTSNIEYLSKWLNFVKNLKRDHKLLEYLSNSPIEGRERTERETSHPRRFSVLIFFSSEQRTLIKVQQHSKIVRHSSY